MPTTHLLQRPLRSDDPPAAEAGAGRRGTGGRAGDAAARAAGAAGLLAGVWSAALAFDRPLQVAGFLALGLLTAALARLLRPSRSHGEPPAYLAVLGGAGALLLIPCAVSLDPVWILPAAALALALPRRRPGSVAPPEEA